MEIMKKIVIVKKHFFITMMTIVILVHIFKNVQLIYVL